MRVRLQVRQHSTKIRCPERELACAVLPRDDPAVRNAKRLAAERAKKAAQAAKKKASSRSSGGGGTGKADGGWRRAMSNRR